MAKLDDFLTKKKETAPILDLFRVTAKSPEEFKKLHDKLPEFKIKPEKVRAEDLKIREKNFKFKAGKKDLKILKQSYAFLDPVPSEMNEVNIDELAVVPIEWKMLTLLRPKTRTEEEMFSRLVELRKLAIKTSAKDRRSYGIDRQIKKTKNKAGVVETKIIACKECGDEFCTGTYSNNNFCIFIPFNGTP
ncbi:uncharacterized protein LOC108741776 isoform X2 [Agrilus planipennis]|uniref:Uncharacterized protein LOC108741776 isoform X2 n=1 Tax=Agrilus planipennis TaxID=224129 RepID=A0A1W4X835_AGRPL|nr:uncharacterized protein LOC108741776 isoform X2 [Agrilus planipennis]